MLDNRMLRNAVEHYEMAGMEPPAPSLGKWRILRELRSFLNSSLKCQLGEPLVAVTNAWLGPPECSATKEKISFVRNHYPKLFPRLHVSDLPDASE